MKNFHHEEGIGQLHGEITHYKFSPAPHDIRAVRYLRAKKYVVDEGISFSTAKRLGRWHKI